MRRQLPEINAGSMADIAFLLLIFFLVTTTLQQDKGIFTKLPPKSNETPRIPFKDKNILDVIINANNELLVENEIIELSSLTQIAINFIDNGGGTDLNGNPCFWCRGAKNPKSSDHPSKALIALNANKSANYGTYIQVLDHLRRAYSQLRDRYSLETYQIPYKDLEEQEQKSIGNKNELRTQILDVRSKYPLLISDSEVQQN